MIRDIPLIILSVGILVAVYIVVSEPEPTTTLQDAEIVVNGYGNLGCTYAFTINTTTYYNKQFQFTFQYPIDWTVDNHEYEPYKNWSVARLADPGKIQIFRFNDPDPDPYNNFQIEVYPKLSTDLLVEYVLQEETNSLRLEDVVLKKFTLNGYQGVSVSGYAHIVVGKNFAYLLINSYSNNIKDWAGFTVLTD